MADRNLEDSGNLQKFSKIPDIQVVASVHTKSKRLSADSGCSVSLKNPMLGFKTKVMREPFSVEFNPVSTHLLCPCQLFRIGIKENAASDADAAQISQTACQQTLISGNIPTVIRSQLTRLVRNQRALRRLNRQYKLHELFRWISFYVEFNIRIESEKFSEI